MGLKSILLNLPEVAAPTERRLPFNQKLKWTGVVLLLFFVLGLVDLFGLPEATENQFKLLSLLLAAEFGSIISLGIGPIVTASILLQLMNGSGILKFDLTTSDGKRFFQGVQKALALAFVVFEAFIYVFTGALAPSPEYSPLLIVFQLVLGGIMIIFMDEVISKWGFGQGISLFIAAQVSKEVIIRLLSPLTQGSISQAGGNLAEKFFFHPDASEAPVGALFNIFYQLSNAAPQEALISLVQILATIFVFVIAVYAQAMKVEIPLSMGRVRGHGIRWPLAFIYTSVIPVILTAALLANVQLGAQFLDVPFLGTYDPNTGSATGFVAWLSPPNIIDGLIRGGAQPIDFARAVTYALFLMGGAVLFSIFWVKTAGMDARSQAKKMMDYGLQIPGFRRDERVLESLLNRYIPALTVLGGLTVGFLAAIADLSGALTQGTGLLLAVMIIYKLYEEIAQQHAMDMNPMLRKFMEK